LAYERNGDEEALKKNPIDHLFKLYVQINAEMSAEKETIEAQKKEGKDVSALEASSLDEQARKYFKRMVRGGSFCSLHAHEKLSHSNGYAN
jgi:arginyl-tRNA synthetase